VSIPILTRASPAADVASALARRPADAAAATTTTSSTLGAAAGDDDAGDEEATTPEAAEAAKAAAAAALAEEELSEDEKEKRKLKELEKWSPSMSRILEVASCRKLKTESNLPWLSGQAET
jgi:hypothetical protein